MNKYCCNASRQCCCTGSKLCLCMSAVMPGTKLQEHTGSDKAWVWSTMDFASEEQRMELFCLKLPSPASMCHLLLQSIIESQQRDFCCFGKQFTESICMSQEHKNSESCLRSLCRKMPNLSAAQKQRTVQQTHMSMAVQQRRKRHWTKQHLTWLTV